MVKSLMRTISTFYFGETPQQIENSRQKFLIRFFAVTGSLFLVPIGILSMVEERVVLGTILFTATAIFLLLLKLSGIDKRLGFLRFSYSALLSLFILYLVFSGGALGTGIYYAFSICMLIVCYTGHRIGTALAIALLTIIALVFWWEPSWLHRYPPHHPPRIVVGLGCNFLMMLIFEWMRMRSYGALTVQAENHKHSSMTDSLTGVLNRHGLGHELQQWPHERFPAVVGMLDIDHFKKVNDAYGHPAGDLALISLTQLIRRHIKGRDLLCRWGGEEFAVVMANTTPGDMHKVLDDIRQALNQLLIDHGGHQFTISFSAGISLLTAVTDLSHALRIADKRLYYAKQTGRNRVVSG